MSHVGKIFRTVLVAHGRRSSRVSHWYDPVNCILVHVEHGRCGCRWPFWSHPPSAPVSSTPFPTPTWSCLSSQQTFLECPPTC